MRRWRWLSLCVAIAAWLAASATRASEAGVLFEHGVEHAEHGRWEEAALSFEQALALEDRPSLRFNLVQAFAELGRPLDVARHAIAFLNLPAEPHRSEARAKVQRALENAQRQLARLDTTSLPAGGRLTVNDAEALRDSQFVYVSPGAHRLVLMVPGATEAERVEITLRAGELQFWPRQTRPLLPQLPPVALPEPSEPAVATPVSATASHSEPTFENVNDLWLAHESRLRRRLAWSLGIAGALGFGIGLGSYAAAQNELKELRASDPFMPGTPFFDHADANRKWKYCAAAFATTGAALASLAITVGDHTTDQRSSLWAWGALGTGAALMASGIVMSAREPELIDNTNVLEPSRYAGSLLLSAALPLLTYAVTYAVRHRRDDVAPHRVARNEARVRR